MTAPTLPSKSPTVSRPAPAKQSGSPFAPTPPDHRTTALQSAVAVLRGRAVVNTKDVLDMAEAFYQFLKAKENASLRD